MKSVQLESNSPRNTQRQDFVRLMLASAFGLGLSPIAPGTCGALLGVMIHLLIAFVLPVRIQLAALILAFIVVCTVHYWVTSWAQQYWKESDPQHFVLDEVAGYLLVPILFSNGQLWQVALWGFLLFRVLDIIKVPPAKQIDRYMHSASGIILDDLVSAGYAVIALYTLRWIGSHLSTSDWLIR